MTRCSYSRNASGRTTYQCPQPKAEGRDVCAAHARKFDADNRKLAAAILPKIDAAGLDAYLAQYPNNAHRRDLAQAAVTARETGADVIDLYNAARRAARV